MRKSAGSVRVCPPSRLVLYIYIRVIDIEFRARRCDSFNIKGEEKNWLDFVADERAREKVSAV